MENEIGKALAVWLLHDSDRLPESLQGDFGTYTTNVPHQYLSLFPEGLLTSRLIHFRAGVGQQRFRADGRCIPSDQRSSGGRNPGCWGRKRRSCRSKDSEGGAGVHVVYEVD